MTQNSAQSDTGVVRRNSPAATRIRLRNFSRSLPMSLLKAREAVMTHFRPGLRMLSLTEQQWRVLRALTTIDKIGMHDLAIATLLLPPSLTRILRDLEVRGLVVRSPVPEDQRRGNVSISPAGAALIERAGLRSEFIYAEITRRYGAEKLAQLQTMLHDLELVLADPIEVPADLGSDD